MSTSVQSEDPQKQKVEERVYEPPVAWLLGRQLMASLKSILLYTAFGNKIDARDWMDAKVFPSDDPNTAAEKWRTSYARAVSAAQPAEAAGTGEDFWKKKREFWFDYISDTGDGMTATYSIAYLCLSNLWVKEYFAEEPTGNDAKVHLDHTVADGSGNLVTLPRGEFLLVGGDTSYHMSDYSSLHIRFQTPFNWAYQDLEQDLKKAGKQLDDEQSQNDGTNRRPLFGIPGNHDYYDMLDGFRRQFRIPIRTRPENKVYDDEDLSAPQLMIRGFKRLQQTSYVALRLPFNWMLWGLDTEIGKIDERQRDFFKGLRDGSNPQRLIVATSAPTTVFGKYADPDDEKSSKAFLQLGLPRPFLRGDPKPEEKEAQAKEKKLQPEQIRLDIAGDVHQYARYWGPPSKSGETTRPQNAKGKLLSATNYASVVSGLGGAFHHPSTTYVGEIREQCLYPTEDASRRAVAAEIFSPVKVLQGGGVWVMGGVIALLLAFSAIAGQSSRQAIHNFWLFNKLQVTKSEPYKATVATLSPPAIAAITPQVVPHATEAPGGQFFEQTLATKSATLKPETVSATPFPLWTWLGVADKNWRAEVDLPANADPEIRQKCEQSNQRFLWGQCSVKWPADYTIGLVMLLVTVLIITSAFIVSELYYTKSAKQYEADKLEPSTMDEKAARHNRIAKVINWSLWLTFLANCVLGLFGIFSIKPYRAYITPFGNSLWVLLTLVWGITSIIFSVRYSDWLFAETSRREVKGRDWALPWLLTIAAVMSVSAGLWLFGQNNLPAYLVSDIAFVMVVAATLILMIYAGYSMGGEHQKLGGKLAMGALGFWHWLLQLAVALFLIKKGTWLTVFLVLILFIIFKRVGRSLMRNNNRWGLLGAWFVFGALMLISPVVGFFLSKMLVEFAPGVNVFWPNTVDSSVTFAAFEWWGHYTNWGQLLPLGIAAVFGALLSCVWVGWYFAVCLGFNGHNNESGGAARIENFKQLIRFRLTEDDLTGYVIAVDKPEKQGSKLDPKLIDVFRLVANKP